MTDPNRPLPEEDDALRGAALEAVVARCAAHGLVICGARRAGAMLELRPASLDALPDAMLLRQLADELGGDGVRYVTLALEAEDDR